MSHSSTFRNLFNSDGTLNAYTLNHLDNWLDRVIAEDEGENGENNERTKLRLTMIRVVESNPSLLNDMGWPQIRLIALEQKDYKAYQKAKEMKRGNDANQNTISEENS